MNASSVPFTSRLNIRDSANLTAEARLEYSNKVVGLNFPGDAKFNISGPLCFDGIDLGPKLETMTTATKTAATAAGTAAAAASAENVRALKEEKILRERINGITNVDLGLIRTTSDAIRLDLGADIETATRAVQDNLNTYMTNMSEENTLETNATALWRTGQGETNTEMTERLLRIDGGDNFDNSLIAEKISSAHIETRAHSKQLIDAEVKKVQDDVTTLSNNVNTLINITDHDKLTSFAQIITAFSSEDTQVFEWLRLLALREIRLEERLNKFLGPHMELLDPHLIELANLQVMTAETVVEYMAEDNARVYVRRLEAGPGLELGRNFEGDLTCRGDGATFATTDYVAHYTPTGICHKIDHQVSWTGGVFVLADRNYFQGVHFKHAGEDEGAHFQIIGSVEHVNFLNCTFECLDEANVRNNMRAISGEFFTGEITIKDCIFKNYGHKHCIDPTNGNGQMITKVELIGNSFSNVGGVCSFWGSVLNPISSVNIEKNQWLFPNGVASIADEFTSPIEAYNAGVVHVRSCICHFPKTERDRYFSAGPNRFAHFFKVWNKKAPFELKVERNDVSGFKAYVASNQSPGYFAYDRSSSVISVGEESSDIQYSVSFVYDQGYFNPNAVWAPKNDGIKYPSEETITLNVGNAQISNFLHVGHDPNDSDNDTPDDGSDIP